ncbi:MAG: MBL fold metallo-hydrolase [Tannerella sp.]|jgi:glyoxylase-like metal-dependent hydrolase (beta-lactamase superfamily II)|nr:MBL fold metallo-hydrolase [Tannerella sp.]
MIQVKQFTFNVFSENTYLLYDETREAAVIDCGCMRQHEEKEFSAFIADNHLTLKRLLCTHYHFDHVVGNSFIFGKYGLKPEIHRNERGDTVPTLAMQAEAFGFAATVEDVDTEHYIEDNEELLFGASALQALLVPGHSPASLAFYCKASKTVFSGDTLFQSSIGRTDLWGGNYARLITSIRDRLLTLPDAVKVYPGHGPATSISFEKRNNPYLTGV